MAILFLSKHELLTLSTYSRIRPESLSPLTRLYADQTMGLDAAKLQEAANEMLANKYIEKQGDKILLAKNLEPAFFILHRPERVIAFKRLSMAEIHEIYFAMRNGFAVQYTVRYDGLFETLVYPFSIDSILRWYDEELLKGLELSNSPMPRLDIRLTADETILLYALIHIYRQRISASKKGLNDDETWIRIEEIRNIKDIPGIKGLLSTAMTGENMESYLGKNPNLDKVVAGLVSKRLLISAPRGITYTREAKAALDPGQVIDGAIVKTYSGGKGSLFSVNFVKNGYVLFSPYPDSIDYRLRTVASSVGKKDILCGFLKQAGVDIPQNNEKAVHPELKAAAEKVPSELKTAINTACSSQITDNEILKAPPADEKRFCSQCGAVLSKGSAFCRNCGRKINFSTSANNRV